MLFFRRVEVLRKSIAFTQGHSFQRYELEVEKRLEEAAHEAAFQIKKLTGNAKVDYGEYMRVDKVGSAVISARLWYKDTI